MVVQAVPAAQVAAVHILVLVQEVVILHQFLHLKVTQALTALLLQAEAEAVQQQPVQQEVLQEVQAVQAQV